MNMPLISVIIPTYNREVALAAAVRSVLAQTYSEFEIIVVDDGSVDQTADVVAALIEQDRDGGRRAARIRYVRQPNMGQSAARNTGITKARGSWIGFLDSDDTWLPGKLEWQVRTIEQCGDGCGACFTDARLVDSSGLDVSAFAKAGLQCPDQIGVVADALRRLATRFGGIWLQTLVVRGEMIKEMGGFDACLRFAEDHDFLFRLSLITRFAYVNRPLVVIDRTSRNVNPSAQSRTWDKVDFRLREEQHRLEKWLGLAGTYPADVRKAVLRNLRGVHSGWANWHLENGDFDQARHAVAKAIGYQFTARLACKWALIRLMPRLARRIAPRSVNML